MPANTARPKWLDDDCIKICVRSAKDISADTDISIDSVDLNVAVPKGENYMSVANRLKVVYRIVDKDQTTEHKLEEISFIVKMLNENNELSALLGQKMFDREAEVYRNIVPKLLEIMKETNSDSKMFCKLVHSVGEHPRFLILEDLKPKGYVMGDRLTGFDLVHCKHILQKIARFHASSMCHFYNLESLKLKFNQGIFEIEPFDNEENQAEFIRSVRNRTRGLIADLEKRNQTKYRNIVDYLTKYMNNLEDVMFHLTTYRPDNTLNALNHVDFWVNNIMLKYSQDGNIDNIAIIDFQCCQYTTVGYDFNFFFFTSTNMDVRRNCFEELYRYYFGELADSLKEMNYEGQMPTLDEFKKDLRDTRLIAIHTLLVMMPLFLMKLDKWPSSEDNSEEVPIGDLIDMSERQGNSLYMDTLLASLDVLIENEIF